MSSDQAKTTLRFQIRSLDRDRPIIDAVPAAENLSSELQAILATRFPGVTVEIRRDEGIPFAREVQELLLYVDWHAVGVAVETTAAGWVTKEFLKLVKAKLRNVFAKPSPAPASPSTAPATPTALSDQKPATRNKKKSGKPRKASGGLTKKSQSSRKRRKR